MEHFPTMSHRLPHVSRSFPLITTSLLTTGLALAGCNRPAPEPRAATPAVADAGSARSRPAAPPPSGPTGSVEGVVRLTGTVPPPEPIVINADVSAMRGCADSARGYYANPYGIAAAGPLPEALVTVDARASSPPPARRRTATFNDCTIEPRVLAMDITDTLVLHASTDAHHLTKVDGMGATIAQMLMPTEDQEKTLQRPGRYILHSVLFPNWMQTPLIVMRNPFYDQTGREGRYRINNLPAGTYTMHAWFPGLQDVSASVTITAGATAQVDFALAAQPLAAVRPPMAPPSDAGAVIP